MDCMCQPTCIFVGALQYDLKILVMLLAFGLLFVLDIPASFFVSILFGLHAGDNSAISNQACSGRFISLGKAKRYKYMKR